MIVRSFHRPERPLVQTLVLALTALAVVACTSTSTTEQSPGPRVTRFDGTYQGIGKATRKDRKVCTDTWTVPVIIQNGEVSHFWNPDLNTVLKGLIAEDGSFTAQAEQHGTIVTLTGKVEGTTMIADAKGQHCDYHMEFTKA